MDLLASLEVNTALALRSEIARKAAGKLRQREAEGRRFSSDWMPGGPRRNVRLMSNPAATATTAD